MILVIGGVGSGKRDYVRELGYEDALMADAVMDERPVLYNLQDLVFSQPEKAMDLMDALLEKDVVICHEVGSGVIPALAHDRAGREATGRLCSRLAAQADKVVRMICGIPLVLKDDPS